MNVQAAVAAVLQIVGLLIAGAVAVVAWGVLGGFAWLAVVLYLVGEDLAPESPDTQQTRGR